VATRYGHLCLWTRPHNRSLNAVTQMPLHEISTNEQFLQIMWLKFPTPCCHMRSLYKYFLLKSWELSYTDHNVAFIHLHCMPPDIFLSCPNFPWLSVLPLTSKLLHAQYFVTWYSKMAGFHCSWSWSWRYLIFLAQNFPVQVSVHKLCK
jgi:hypothetical protein